MKSKVLMMKVSALHLSNQLYMFDGGMYIPKKNKTKKKKLASADFDVLMILNQIQYKIKQ